MSKKKDEEKKNLLTFPFDGVLAVYCRGSFFYKNLEIKFYLKSFHRKIVILFKILINYKTKKKIFGPPTVK